MNAMPSFDRDVSCDCDTRLLSNIMYFGQSAKSISINILLA
jgi:hypothetical protein